MPDPWLIQYMYLSELIAQVDRANIGLQVSDTIADRLRQGTNKYCLVKWQTVTPPPPRRGEGVICTCEECVARVHVTKRACGG